MKGKTMATKINTRFSKQFMLDSLSERIERMADELGLKENHGYAQVTGKGEAWNRAYGEFRAYCDLHSDIDSGNFDWARIENDRLTVTRAAEADGMGDQGGWG
jgi:hypothetical protein